MVAECDGRVLHRRGMHTGGGRRRRAYLEFVQRSLPVAGDGDAHGLGKP